MFTLTFVLCSISYYLFLSTRLSVRWNLTTLKLAPVISAVHIDD